VFIVATPEMRNVVSAFTSKAVRAHFDLIDFGLMGSVRKNARDDRLKGDKSGRGDDRFVNTRPRALI
jgi:hypothetical protein